MANREDFKKNITLVNGEIWTLKKIKANIEEIKNSIEKQKDFIPINNDKKDEMGENVEEYLDDLMDMLQNRTIDEIEKVCNDDKLKNNANYKDNLAYQEAIQIEKTKQEGGI